MISFLIPFRGNGDRYREESYRFVTKQIKKYWAPDGVELITCDKGTPDFNRSASRNLAAQKANGDVFVFLDADTNVPPEQVYEAVLAVQKGLPWAFPYTYYCSLTEAGSQKYMTAGSLDSVDFTHVFPSIENPEPSVGGCVVVSRQAFDFVAGYDERFDGWGEEDRAFAMSLETLAGPPVQVPGRLYHLWHPAPKELCFYQPHFMDNRLLCNRYREARGNRPAMEQLVAERR